MSVDASKTAVITGASRGIGAALARMLHARGVKLGLASRSGDDLGLAAVVAEACDVRDLEALSRLAVYCASKFGQVGFTRALDHEMREHGIRCPNICPGGVAEVVVFALERPRHLRILETALRPMTEASWG